MPCDIGYKSYTPVVIAIPKPVRPAVPQPKKFEVRTVAPQIDADLAAKLGMEDPDFLAWAQEVDIIPLQQEALKRALAKIDMPNKLRFEISSDGMLVSRGSYLSDSEKAGLQKKVDEVNGQFQMELFQIIAQIMDYETVLAKTDSGGDLVWTLEGEKNENAGVHKYLRVSKGPGERGEVEFEHFDSGKTLETEMDKFFVLAQRLGLGITLGKSRKSGRPIPGGTVHRDFLKIGN